MAIQDQGTAPPDGGQGTHSNPDTVTVEMMNRAISSRLKDFEKKLDKQFSELPNVLSSKLEEAMKAKTEPVTDPGAKGQSVNPLDHPEVRGMQRRLQELEDRAKQLEAEKNEERARNKDATLRSQLQEELMRCGVDPKRVRLAIGHLVDAEKKVRWDESGESILFYDSGGSVSLNHGIKSWVGTEDGKLFLPPRGTSGTGGRTPGGKGSGNNQTTVDRGALADGLLTLMTGGEFESR